MKSIQHLNNDLSFSACPICHGKEIKTIGSVKYSKMIFADTPIALKNKPYYAYCLQCKSGFIQNAIQEKDANALYAAKGSERWISKVPFTERRTKKTVKLIADLLLPQKRILDIGCSTGQLLEFARQFNCECYGIESSKPAQKICQERGHKCVSSINDIKISAPFDIIFLIDTIEHIYDVPAFLNILIELLKNDGHVVILTGNINSVPAKIFKNSWWYIRFPEHIVFPSVKYFTHFSDFKVQNHLKTYAFKSSQEKSRKKIKSSIKKLLSRKSDGHNFFFPDHYCVVLMKNWQKENKPGYP
jgi:2-polyprenyl-3-methyl-5-hydroxy-6-metoxy-1,4-benzoquinol methylase